MRRVLSGAGRALIVLGILILLFVVYQLWGTGIYTAQAQNRLENELEQNLRRAGGSSTPQFPSATAPASTASTTTTTAPPPPVAAGEALAQIRIDRIGLDWTVVEGVGEADLRNGPGHYPLTPLPGQAGNSAIAGHRTTYGAPFFDLDQLAVGDMIQVTTVQGTFDYKIFDVFIVAPDAYEVLDADPERRAILTLTTCNPKYSAAERLIVQAELQVPIGSVPLPPTVDSDDASIDRAKLVGEGLSGSTGSRTPTVIAGLVLLLVGALWWLLFHRHPRWTTWFIGVVPFAVAVAVFYFYLERVLPANY